jgi:hypothetical protein
MSKKNKINNDPFNMSVEEATKTADLINELVKGNKNITIDDIVDNETLDINGKISSFTQQIEDFINVNISDEEYFHYESETSDTPVISVESKSDESTISIDNGFENKTKRLYPVIENNEDISSGQEMPAVIDERIEPKFNEITVGWNPLFNTMEIDDGEIKHYFDLDEMRTFNPFIDGNCELSNLVSGELDDDEAGSIYSELFYYIITRKVPTMIIPADEFEVSFGIFSKIDRKYVFFKKDAYVLVYTIGSHVYDDFYNLMGLDSDFIPLEVVKSMVNVIRELNKSPVKFSFENIHLIDSLIDYSKRNLKSFVEEVSLTATFAGHNSFNKTVWQNLKVLSYDTFVSDIEEKLSISNNIDDDELEDLEETISTESDFDEYPDLSDVVGDDESLLATEPPKVIEPVKPSNTGSMTIPVFRKKK